MTAACESVVEVEALHDEPAGLEPQPCSSSFSIGSDEDMYHPESSRFFGPSRDALEEVCVHHIRCFLAQEVLDRCHLADFEGGGARQREHGLMQERD